MEDCQISPPRFIHLSSQKIIEFIFLFKYKHTSINAAIFVYCNNNTIYSLYLSTVEYQIKTTNSCT